MQRPHLTIAIARKVRDIREREGLGWEVLAERFSSTPVALRAAVSRADAVDAGGPPEIAIARPTGR